MGHVNEVAAEDWELAEWAHEARAEFGMSWVCGGGNRDDANTAFDIGLTP
jgi:hypothetical protein